MYKIWIGKRLTLTLKICNNMQTEIICVLTGDRVNGDLMEKRYFYNLIINGVQYIISFPSYYMNNRPDNLVKNSHTIHSLIANQKWPVKEYRIDLDEKIIQRVLQDADYPRTEALKLDNLLRVIADLGEGPGAKLLSDQIYNQKLIIPSYFRSSDELELYVRTLQEKNWLFYNGMISRFNITYEGLLRLVEIDTEGPKSNNCFVAMSFDSIHNSIYENAILPALTEEKYTPIILNRMHLDNKQTINDEIVASIKKSRFCIADFTGNKDGVYFEAGYAFGRGMKVIYTCHKKDMGKLHFDISHYQFIFYESDDDLKLQLQNRIQVLINP